MVGAGAQDIWGEGEGVGLVQPEEDATLVGHSRTCQYL